MLKQDPCDFYPISRMTDCSNWKVTSSWSIPYDATTGVYIAVPRVLVNQTKGNSDISHNSSYLYERYNLIGSFIPIIIKTKII